jgi:uncharacterized protein (TIGR02569 family)
MPEPKSTAPSAAVLAAFGADEQAMPLSGGWGEAWRAGAIVLKPMRRRLDQLQWEADLLDNVRPKRLRVAPFVRTRAGSLVADGWSAWRFVEGERRSDRWAEVIAAGERLHRALVGVPRPSFLDSLDDPWTIGERAAWGELSAQPFVAVPHVAELLEATGPLEEPSQVIHTDLASNTLVADGLPPAVIDFSPGYRPVRYASAIVVADALVWHGAKEDVVELIEPTHGGVQHLLRALVFRLVSDKLVRDRYAQPFYDPDPFARAVTLTLAAA